MVCYFCRALKKIEFYRQILVTLPDKQFQVIRPVRGELFDEDRQLSCQLEPARHDEDTVVYRNFAKRPNK